MAIFKHRDPKVNSKVLDISSIIKNFSSTNKTIYCKNVSVKQVANLIVNETPDFNYYSFLPNTYRNQTPLIAVVEINNDGIEDVK